MARKKRLKKAENGYAATPGTGKIGETCKSCIHLIRFEYCPKKGEKHKVYKYCCNLNPDKDFHKRVTRIKTSSPACSKFEKKEIVKKKKRERTEEEKKLLREKWRIYKSERSPKIREQILAHREVERAERNRILIKTGFCKVCGAERETEFHHPDDTKWLEVVDVNRH